MAGVTVDKSGPLFDGRVAIAITEMVADAQEEIAQMAYATVMLNLHTSIRHPTPYYETQIINEYINSDNVIHDRGIIYGPWLEGVGSRNRTTRFKGYWSFRRATTEVMARLPATLEAISVRYQRRMNE